MTMGLLDDILSSAGGERWGPWNSLYSTGSADPAQFNAPQGAAVPMPQLAPPAPQAPPDRTLAIGHYRMPVYDGAPLQGEATPPSARPSPSLQMLTDASPTLGDRLSAGLASLANSRGLIPALANGIQGFASGRRADPTGVAGNLTVRALQARGVSPADAQAAIGNPAILRSLINRYYGAPARTPGARSQLAVAPGNSADTPDPAGAPPAAAPAAAAAQPSVAPRPLLRAPTPRGVTRNGIRWNAG
jgi:hypothetical protein